MVEKSPFEDVDSVRLNMGHLRIWFTSGMGFFTDAYDLFIIGIVLILLTGPFATAFHLNIVQSALIGTSALAAAIIGQLLFGRLADIFGRKKVYGIEATILAIGAILSAFSPSFIFLFLSRFLLGIGIGGDYPVSATIMSEYSNTKDRGKLIGLVFANQGIGSVVAVAVGVISVIALPADIAWRFMLAFGAIPAMAVIYLRRKLPETPRYSLLVNNNKDITVKAKEVVGIKNANEIKASTKVSSFSIFITSYWKILVITMSTWFMLDIAYYGTGIYSSPIVSNILPATNLPMKVLIAGLPFMVGFFGYFTAVALLDKIGRKTIQIQGFFMMAILYIIVSSVMVTHGLKVVGFIIPVDLAFILYSLTFFFIDFGPNQTTFILPAELFPVKYRTTGHGLSAAAGKTGAAISTLLFPSLLLVIGIKELLLLLGVISIIGGVTSFFLKEPMKKSLEDASNEKLLLEVPS
jgi:PHS family inorganic phosphate transporter-like MFS transporter